MKNKIRPIYAELQGYMSQAPAANNSSTDDNTLWKQLNNTIDELTEVSGGEYSKFKITNIDYYSGGAAFMNVSEYRSKLGGLIARLHGEFFHEEPAPFSGMPSTVIHQNQYQQQTVQIKMLLEIQSKVDEKIKEAPEGSKERSFLEQLKSGLYAVSGVTELVALILKLAHDTGLHTADLIKLFS